MRVIRCSPWTILVVVILADVAPSPSCGSGSGSETGYLQIGASDCTCAPGTILVSLDGREIAGIGCTSSGYAISIPATVGSHVVSARSGNAVWPDQTCYVRADSTTSVELGCP